MTLTEAINEIANYEQKLTAAKEVIVNILGEDALNKIVAQVKKEQCEDKDQKSKKNVIEWVYNDNLKLKKPYVVNKELNANAEKVLNFARNNLNGLTTVKTIERIHYTHTSSDLRLLSNSSQK